MGMKTRSPVSSEREKWDKIFEGLVKLLKSQQQHLETLAQERKLLEDRIKLQYERWASDVRLYEAHISQMNTYLESKEIACVLEAAKADLMVGLKQREADLCKLKLEETEDGLCDLRVWFDILSKNSKDVPKETKKGMPRCKDCGSKFFTSSALEGGLQKLKLAYENLALQTSSQIAALMTENKFAWNQLNILESRYMDKLNSKQSEFEKANRKIEVLISNMEDLRSSDAEKDEIIERLKSEVSRKEADADRLNEEVSKLSKEVELLRRKFSRTPVIRRCSEGGRTSVLGGENGGRDGIDDIKKKERSASVPDILKDNGKGSRSLKRKKNEEIPISETPKLFTSTFKVPRLKASSPKTT